MLLLVTFQPSRGTTIVPIRPVKDKFSGVQWYITIVTVGTIILWCIAQQDQVKAVLGDMGVVAIIPMALFFGTGILTKEDFNNFLWTIIILAAGGLSLGKAVSSSGLLETIAQKITVGIDGMSFYAVLVIFAALILVVATFISHTVAAIIILPVMLEIGKTLGEQPRPDLLVMVGALMCSAAMGLPTSGFPNMSKLLSPHTMRWKLTLSSRHHDGGLSNWTTLSPGQAFHQSWCSFQHHHFLCRHISRILAWLSFRFVISFMGII